MELVINTDLFIVGLTIVGIAVLGFIIYFNDKKSLTGKAFLFLSLFTILYNGTNYLTYKFINPEIAIWMLRLTIFFAVWHSFFTFHLLFIFPEKQHIYPRFYKIFIVPLVSVTALLTLTPLVFREVMEFSGGRISSVANGPAVGLFAITTIGLNLVGLVFFIKKILSQPKKQRKQLIFVLAGFLATIFLLLMFNLILPAFLDNSSFVTWGAAFNLPFLIFTYYAIIRHKLLDIKVISTELLVIGLSVAILFEVITSEDFITIIYKGSLFLLVLSVGILLIKSVRNEVQQREELAKLANSLKQANTKLKELDQLKTEFMSIATHQLRTPLSIIKGYTSLLDEGAYGAVTKQQKEIFNNIDISNERLIGLVDEFLNVSRIEQGRTQYSFAQMDFVAMAEGVVKELSQKASPKHIDLKLTVESGVKDVVADEERIRHCLYNFVDNAIKYSPEKSTITIFVEKSKNGLQSRVVDQGVGLDDKDLKNLFQKFYRSEHVMREIDGNGLGLFVVKQFAEAHGGKVWAKSKGIGKGSEFGFWIPMKAVARKVEKEKGKG